MISKSLRAILNDQNISLEILSQKSGLPLETIRNLFYHKAENPRLKTVAALSRALNVPIEALLPESLQIPESNDEKLLLEHYRQCSSHGKHLIQCIASMEAKITLQSQLQNDTHTILHLIPTGTSDSGGIYTACDIRYLDVHCSDAFAAISIPDNALAPEYYQDDIILLTNRFPENGDYAVFFYESRIYLRKVTISPGNKYTLTAIHGRGTDIYLNKYSNYTLMGTCIGVLRDIN